MTTAYPLATLAPTIDSTGIKPVAFSDIQNSLIAEAQNIFGSDVYLGSDSQDGQFIGIFSQAVFDTGQSVANAFNSFSPNYAQGAQLSAQVQINGLTRNSATFSTAVGSVVGIVGATIKNGVVADSSGNLWNLPTTVTIPSSGSISVTVTAQQLGNIAAPIGTINQIVNPQFGWQSFTSTAAAITGLAIETDSELVQRQSVSTSISSLTVTNAILAAIQNLPGVLSVGGYDNDTTSTDVNGVPAGALAVVVLGGVAQTVVNLIAVKKSPGCPTYGNTSGTYVDLYGVPHIINYSNLVQTNIFFQFTIKKLTNWVISTETLIQETLVNFVNSLSIGETVYATQCLGVASLAGNINTIGLSQTFSIEIATFFLDTSVSPSSNADIPIAFNASAMCSISNIVITLV